jgi:hypothetical protein
MWENQENQTPAEAEVIKPTYEELEQQLVGAIKERDFHKSMRETARVRLMEFENKIQAVEDWIDGEGDNLTESQVEELCEALGIDNEITKTVKVDVQFTMEITATRTFDWDSIDGDSFAVSIERSGWGDDWSIADTDDDITDVSVD